MITDALYSHADDILGKYGKEMTWDIKAGLMGKREFSHVSTTWIDLRVESLIIAEREAAAHLLSFFPDLPPEFTLDTYINLRRAGQDALWPTVQPMPGAVKLVRHLHRHKVPIAVATGSQRRNYELKSKHLMDTLFGYFEGNVVCADDGLIKPGRGKPHPDVFLVTAAKCFGRDVGEGEEGEGHVTEAQRLERSKGLIFEDAISGLQAGKRAGAKGEALLPHCDGLVRSDHSSSLQLCSFPIPIWSHLPTMGRRLCPS